MDRRLVNDFKEKRIMNVANVIHEKGEGSLLLKDGDGGSVSWDIEICGSRISGDITGNQGLIKRAAAASHECACHRRLGVGRRDLFERVGRPALRLCATQDYEYCGMAPCREEARSTFARPL
jgi:hypothetical protein